MLNKLNKVKRSRAQDIFHKQASKPFLRFMTNIASNVMQGNIELDEEYHLKHCKKRRNWDKVGFIKSKRARHENLKWYGGSLGKEPVFTITTAVSANSRTAVPYMAWMDYNHEPTTDAERYPRPVSLLFDSITTTVLGGVPNSDDFYEVTQ
jgi:hypothetical protein